MLKSSYTPYLIYIILSIIVVLFAKYINNIIFYIVNLYDYLDDHLEILFNQSPAGILSRSTLALVVCPLLITGTPALIYYFIKRSTMPYFLEATWLTWFIIVLGNSLVK